MIDIVSEVKSLAKRFELGALTPNEYAQELVSLAMRKGNEVLKTYTFVSVCDGVVITKQTLSLEHLTASVGCYDCEYGGVSDRHPSGCPVDGFLSELAATGYASYIERQPACGVDVMIAYVNQ